MAVSSDPYATLGVTPGASDAELRAAYRRLVQLHHPDHNGGSPESARRFEEVQDAYARVRQLRAQRPAPAAAAARANDTAGPDVESRLAAIERELANERAKRDRRAARERAQRAARQATATGAAKRPSDEELGYFKTDDSFSKILADAASELSGATADFREQVSREARERHVGKRVSELIEELESKLTGGQSSS
jgi:curved DNA-binding protein CbpA